MFLTLIRERCSVWSRSLALFAISLLLCAPTPTFAEQKAKQAKAACSGTNMLQEFKNTDPALYETIIAAEKEVKNDGALLWRISGNGMPAPSYLFGTVHLTDERVTNFSTRVQKIITGSAVVALEVADISPSATAKAIAESTDLIVLSDGRRLDQILDKNNFKKVEKVIRRAGMPANMAPLIRPWIISMMIAVSDCERKKVNSGAPVVDSKIANIARRAGIPVVGLETLKSQLQALSAVPEDQQIAMLKVGLAYVDRSNDLMETVLQLYREKRMGAVIPFQLALADKAGILQNAFDAFQNEIIDQRNRQMRTQMLSLLTRGNSFIAVGALHLVGSSGIVALLQDAGYELEPIE